MKILLADLYNWLEMYITIIHTGGSDRLGNSIAEVLIINGYHKYNNSLSYFEYSTEE